MTEYGKSNGVARAIALVAIVLLISLLLSSNVYADEPSTWAREEIEAAKALSATTDSLTETYQEGLTRAEFVELLVKIYESVTDEVIDVSTVKNPFTDTDKVYLLKAYATGIVSGTSPSTFSPDALVTREQMVVMMVRMVENIEKTLELPLLETSIPLKEFDDQSAMATWSTGAIVKAVQSGIISGVGDNRFNPKGNSTKEQAVIVCYRLLTRMTSDDKITNPWKDNLASYESDVEAALNMTLGQYADSKAKAFVIADVLNMRKEPDLSDSGNIIRKLKAYEQVVILSESGDWYQIAASGEEVGYVHSDYIHPYSLEEDLEDIRMQIVAYAKQFVGTPYKYGADSLTDGTDCSGFTGQVMRPFGYVLSRSSSGQGSDGVAITEADLEPGDLITYGYNGGISHVAIYIGNDEIIHATTTYGIKVTEMRGFLRKPLISFRRVVF